jgi:dTDP-4-dehydrorhamnose reductase
MRVAVVGARGQLGAAVASEFKGAHEVVELGRADLDITNDLAVRDTMARAKPDAIINCAAFNDVDGAEDQPVLALNTNAFAVRALARTAGTENATFVHFSSDFVFDGTASMPYTEEDRPNPRSVYAISKLLGEWFAMDAPRVFVLRVESLFGRANGRERPPKGSLEAIRRAIVDGRPARVFEDRTVSPTFVVDAARATRQLLEKGAPRGIYHCVNSGYATWLDVARELARAMNAAARLEPVRARDVTLRATRPVYCALSNAKLQSAGISMPTWQNALQRYVGQI